MLALPYVAQLIDQVVVKNETPFEWVNDHIHMVGWPVLIFVCWQLRGVFDRFRREHNEAMLTLSNTQDIARQTKEGVDLIQRNHFVHLQASVTDLQKEQSDTIKILTSIDKGIGILVDRARPPV